MALTAVVTGGVDMLVMAAGRRNGRVALRTVGIVNIPVRGRYKIVGRLTGLVTTGGRTSGEGAAVSLNRITGGVDVAITVVGGRCSRPFNRTGMTVAAGDCRTCNRSR
ncbi:MAG: hypothetical protein C0623_07940 [Desulfuromonas sp.]|nr:MAG: hypothetical protein C0623_07940 [Desulfuromonas sp.]